MDLQRQESRPNFEKPGPEAAAELKRMADDDFEGSGLELSTSLPEDASVNAAGVPTYANLTGTKLISAITATATIGFLLFGYDQGVMSGLITGPQFLITFPDCNAAIVGEARASLIQATYVSIYELGCLAGALFTLFYGNRLGRRNVIKLGSWIMIVGTIVQVTCVIGYHPDAQFLVARVFTGVGNGMNTATIPSWVAETSRTHNRGLLVCIEASMIATGTVIAYWVDFGMSFIPSSVNWRFPIALQIVFALGLLFGIHFLPESPRWLMSNDRHIDAQRVVAALADEKYDSEVTVLQTRIIMQSLAASDSLGVVRKRNLFTSGPTQHLRRMLVGASSQFFQQIGGANAVIYFAPVIYEQNLGLNRQLALILGGVNVTVYALAAFLSYFTIERVGRRNMFLAGSLGQALSMLIVAFCLITGDANAARGAVVGLFFFLIFFGSTWLELPWLYPAEINPLRTRTNANAVSTMTNWLWNFAVVQWTPPMLTSIGWGTFLFFAVINFCFIPVIWLYYPETAGRSLEEIDVIFSTGFNENRSYVEVARTMPKLTDQEIQAATAKQPQHVDEEASPEGTVVGGN